MRLPGYHLRVEIVNRSVTLAVRTKMDIEDILEVNEKEQWIETRENGDINRRRSVERRPKQDSFFEIDDDDNPFVNVLSSVKRNNPSGDKPRRKSGIWTEQETNDRAVDDNDRVRTAPLSAKSTSFERETEVVPMIPDLEDVINEDFIKNTAAAPKVTDNRLISYKDLKKDTEQSAAFATLDGIELSALTKTLISESQLQEDDIQWTWDNLISDVAIHLSSPE